MKKTGKKYEYSHAVLPYCVSVRSLESLMLFLLMFVSIGLGLGLTVNHSMKKS